jgi:hypothetical protein
MKKNTLLIFAPLTFLFIFFLVYLSSNYIRGWMQEEPTQLNYCPSSDIVVANQSSLSPFKDNGAIWSIDFHGWPPPPKIGFMQAILNSDHNVVCYYQWINPNDKGTNLWMTVKLSPSVTDEILPYGSYWNNKPDKLKLCSAGEEACAFVIKHHKP